MDNDKSIFEKITDTVKDIANIAAEAASHALKAEEPALKAPDGQAAAYTPLATDAMVSDSPIAPPVAMAPARKRKRAAPKRTARKTTKAAKKSGKKSAARQQRKRPRGNRPPGGQRRPRRKPTRKRQRGRREKEFAEGLEARNVANQPFGIMALLGLNALDGLFVATFLTLLYLPGLHALWFRESTLLRAFRHCELREAIHGPHNMVWIASSLGSSQ